MNEKEIVKTSKFLSLVLRHKPEEIGIILDANGWVDVNVLLKALSSVGRRVSRSDLDRVVAENNKKRFAFSSDGRKIRASQGHSVEVDLGYSPAVPPGILFHGTGKKNVGSIFEKGLLKGERHAVHMTANIDTAVSVGTRHGHPVVFAIDSGKMLHDKFEFFVSENGVWLTDHVPAEYIELIAAEN